MPARLRHPVVEDWSTPENAAATVAKTFVNGRSAGVTEALDAASLHAFIAHRRACWAWFDEQGIPPGRRRVLRGGRPVFRDWQAFADRVRRLMAGLPAEP